MLIAILEKLREAFPMAKFVTSAGSNSPYEKRAELKLYQKLWKPPYNICYLKLGSLIPKSIRYHFGLITDNEIDIVLDASGFSYGDQLGAGTTEILAKLAKRWRNRGTKLILLPQSFGPFSTGRIRRAIQLAVECAHLVYARDPLSYSYLSEAVRSEEKLRIAPDFTNLVTPIFPHEASIFKERVCIIPNARMVDKTDANNESVYVELLSLCIDVIRKQNRQVFLLIHEGTGDLALANKIHKKVGSPIEILSEECPRHIKGILASSYAVISSRFHGAVSALSQGVPCIVTSWAHKYEMLLHDYGCSQNFLDLNATISQIEVKLETILSVSANAEIRRLLIQRSKTQKRAVEKMWSEVIYTIRSDS